MLRGRSVSNKECCKVQFKGKGERKDSLRGKGSRFKGKKEMFHGLKGEVM